MKLKITTIVSALLIIMASSVMATNVGWNVATSGSATTYTYYVTSSEEGDWLTAFHVYAPIAPTAVSSWTADSGWKFDAIQDDESGCADLCWSVDNTQGLGYGESLQVSFNVPSSVKTINDYIIPGFIGNWGYDTEMWAEYGTWVMFPSVPVPVPVAVETVPEPISMVSLAIGCAALKFKRRKRS